MITTLVILACLVLFALLFIRVNWDVKISKCDPEYSETTNITLEVNGDEVFNQTWSKKDEDTK